MGYRWLCAAATATLTIAGAAQAAEARDDIIGGVRVHHAVWEDTLMDIARANNLGYVELVAANPRIDPWIPGVGTEVVLPTAHVLPDGPREGIVLNLPEMRLYYYMPDGRVVTHPVGIGQEGWETPSGTTTIVRKKADPAWYPPASIRAENPELPGMVPPGPENPLGTHALYLGWPAYLVHGTNKPDGVGRRVSHGCIRMYPEDIAQMYRIVPPGTKFRAVNQPVKAGWRDGELYLEVHPTLRQVDQVEIDGTMPYEPLPDLNGVVRKAAGEQIDRVDWSVVQTIARERKGLPVRITRSPETARLIAAEPRTVRLR